MTSNHQQISLCSVILMIRYDLWISFSILFSRYSFSLSSLSQLSLLSLSSLLALSLSLNILAYSEPKMLRLVKIFIVSMSPR